MTYLVHEGGARLEEEGEQAKHTLCPDHIVNIGLTGYSTCCTCLRDGRPHSLKCGGVFYTVVDHADLRLKRHWVKKPPF